MMRNALLTACAYLALLCLAPPVASAQKRPYVAPPLVPMAQLQALAVTLSQHSDTTIECNSPKRFNQLLEESNVHVGADQEVMGFVQHPLFADGTIDFSRFIDVIHMPIASCHSMQRIRRNDANAGPSLAVFIHESMHLRLPEPDAEDEGITECTAFANRWQAVEPFHLPTRISKEVLRGMVWFHSQTPLSYRANCPVDLMTASSASQ